MNRGRSTNPRGPRGVSGVASSRRVARAETFHEPVSPMSALAFADDLAGGDVESREERGDAAPPDGPLGWGQVEVADVTDVSDEEGVAGAVERSGYMGREFQGSPGTGDGSVCESGGLGHATCAPVGGVSRRDAQDQINEFLTQDTSWGLILPKCLCPQFGSRDQHTARPLPKIGFTLCGMCRGAMMRTGSSPQVLAALRTTAVRVLEGVEATSKAAAMRRFAAHPHDAIRLIRQ